MRSRPPDRAVTWEELFFDLAFVFALTQLSRLLHDDHSWAGVGRLLILFLILYWSWVATTLYTDQRDVGNALDRTAIFALGFGNLLLALTIPGAYGARAVQFTCAYLAIRALLLVLVLRVFAGWRALLHGPYAVALVSGPLLLAGAFLPGPPRIVLWSITAALDVLSPWYTRRSLVPIQVRPLHYTQRYGLLVILALGESVIQVGAVAVDEPLTLVRWTAIGTGYALVCALWWTYFSAGAQAFRPALERPEQQGSLRRSILILGHLVITFGIITIAVGMAEVVLRPTEPLPSGEAVLLFGGAALFLGTFAYTHWRIHRQVAWRRIGAAAGGLILLPVSTLLPALAALATLLGLVVGLSAVEELIRRRGGGPAAEDEVDSWTAG